MEAEKVAVIGFKVPKTVLSTGSTERIKEYLSGKTKIYGRILFTFSDYLTKYSRQFDRVSYYFTSEENQRFRNGTLKGIIGKINRSEIDIGLQPVAMNEMVTEMADFSYPYRLYSSTFVTRKAEYEPQMFNLLQIFPISLWVSIVSVLMTMSLVYFVTFRRKCSFAKTLLHSFAVLLRQSSILKPSSMIEKLLVFSWVAGAMFICLAYDSVSLSFLAFPPIDQIKDVPQLAKAVQRGDFHCVMAPQSAILDQLYRSKDENLRILAQDAKMNNIWKDGSILRDFLLEKSRKDIAIILNTDVVDFLSAGNKFVSEDRFLESMAAPLIAKDFCCKRLVEKFVHRLMASGLHSKYADDKLFFGRLPHLLAHKEKDTSKRTLTLIDVAPAFMFLIFGYVISFLVLLVEIISSRMRNRIVRRGNNM